MHKDEKEMPEHYQEEHFDDLYAFARAVQGMKKAADKLGLDSVSAQLHDMLHDVANEAIVYKESFGELELFEDDRIKERLEIKNG